MEPNDHSQDSLRYATSTHNEGKNHLYKNYTNARLKEKKEIKMDRELQRREYIDTLKKCCELNEIGPADFYSSSFLIVLEDFIKKGGSLEQFQEMVTGSIEKIVEMFESFKIETPPPT
jgi:hypothetical protein